MPQKIVWKSVLLRYNQLYQPKPVVVEMVDPNRTFVEHDLKVFNTHIEIGCWYSVLLSIFFRAWH